MATSNLYRGLFSLAALSQCLANPGITIKTRGLMDSPCNNNSDSFTSYNATGNFSIPGFVPPGVTDTGNWTLSTALYRQAVQSRNQSFVVQNFWLDTAPVQDLSSSDLPYTGCAILLTLAHDKVSTGTNGNNSCNGVFSDKCFNALKDAAQSAAESLSGTFNSSYRNSSRPSFNCSETIMPVLSVVNNGDACKGSRWDFTQASGDIFGVPDPYTGANITGSTCSSNLGNGSSESAWLITSESLSVGYDDFTAYNSFTKRANPLLLAVWSKNGTGSNAWADTLLVCPSANQIVPGSKASAGVVGTQCWNVASVGLIAAVISMVTLL